jgi:hypothetical protein
VGHEEAAELVKRQLHVVDDGLHLTLLVVLDEGAELPSTGVPGRIPAWMRSWAAAGRRTVTTAGCRAQGTS